MSHPLNRRHSKYSAATLTALLVMTAFACSFDDRDVRERPALEPGDGDGDGDAGTSGDGDGDTSTGGDGDGDTGTSGDGDGDTTDSVEEACDYALVAMSYLVELCVGAYFSEASCPGTTETDIDALVACGDEAYLATCEEVSGDGPSPTPTCDVLSDEGKIYLLLAAE